VSDRRQLTTAVTDGGNDSERWRPTATASDQTAAGWQTADGGSGD
jgi:hypothetical protein